MKSVLITGAGRRIGAHLARHLGAKGWHVFVHYNRARAEAEDVAAEIRAQGGSASTLGADLADEQAASRLIAACEAVGPLTLLINNASLFLYDSAATTSFAAMEANMRVNLYAPVMLAQAFYTALKARGAEGVVINLVDNKVFALNPDYFSYTLSKVALQGMIQMLAMACAPTLRIAGIAPGITLISGAQSQAEFERTHNNNPLGRGCTPEQIAGAVDFILASPSYHGQTLVIDGGQVLQRRPRDIAFLARDAANADI
ncbi:SDR family oxidoreductase [Acidocella sp.]|uniref:SDR family oxidoreductase n=1 Tax=Acidocella sp. TaxID=50710 RepID=UPI00261F37AA|nr:SDR family oxidoreductase [Acidocella sp.]